MTRCYNYLQIYFFFFYEFTRDGDSKIMLTFGYYFRIGCPEQFHKKTGDISTPVTRGVARNLLRGTNQDVLGRKSPAGSRDRAPVGVWGRSPQKPETNVDKKNKQITNMRQ